MSNEHVRRGKRVIVLDTSAFVAGFDPLSIGDEQYTVPMVRDEIMRNSMSWARFRTATESGKLRIKTPEENSVTRAKESASAIGDKFFLSEADIQVLALAIELKTKGTDPLIVTDDYSIQNVANLMKIEFAPLSTFGIRFRLQWIRYCPACHRKYPSNYKFMVCEICGTRLKRKSLKKSRLNS
jgi:UPF0271 protein